MEPGYYNLRLATDGGVSLPVVIGVDRLPQRPFAAETAESCRWRCTAPSVGSTRSRRSFAGKAGQKVLVEVEAQRLGSKLRPVIHLIQCQTSANRPGRGARPPSTATPAWKRPSPQMATYTVAVHDTEYAAAGARASFA